MPAGYMLTQKGEGEGIDVSCVENAGENVALSDSIAFRRGQITQVAAAAIPIGSFSGRVWNDLNNNGIMDADEPGMPGVELILSGVKTKSEYRLVTDETGEYRFPMIRNDNYNFSAVLPQDHLFARYSQTGGDSRSVFTVAGTTASRQFPVSGAADVVGKNVGVIQSSILEGIAFFDTNYNGILDEGEGGYPGVKVEATRANGDPAGSVITGEDGVYRLTGLRGGEYRLRAILPADGSFFSVVPTATGENANLFVGREGRRENTISPVMVDNGGITRAVIGVAQGSQITGTVFLDADYDGLMKDKEKKFSGVKVELRDQSGTAVQSATTNANGNYTLSGVMPGEYTLHFLRKDRHAFTRLRQDQEGGNWVKGLEGDYGATNPFPVTMGRNIEGVYAGMLPSSTLKGMFFNDLDDNGLQGEGEAGMAGVTVRLYSQDAEVDLTAEVSADGQYFFDGVMPGEYTLTYRLPEHAELAKVAEGGNTLEGQGRETVTKPFAMESGVDGERPLVGAVTLGTFEGVFFHDPNANGVIDAGEETMAGLRLTLTPSRADLQPVTAEAGNDGRFSVTGLRPADYQMAMQLPEGYIFSANLSASSLTLDTVGGQEFSCPWKALTNRAQNTVGAVKPATIRGYVFLDENRSGSQDEGEALMSGLAFELVCDGQGNLVKRASSAEDGYVTFTNVRPGAYLARFGLPAQSEPAGEAGATFIAESGRMTQKGIVVGEGETYDNIHAGLVSRTSIGGTLALEENGRRSSLEGINVRLYLGDGQEPQQTAVTDASGRYRFDGLWPENYRLEADLPAGMIFVRPGDPNFQNDVSVIAAANDIAGSSESFQLKMAQHRLNENVLYIRPAKVGDLAWLDLNKNGLMDAEEPRIPGLTVTLMSGGQVAAETQTDAAGYYLFPDVYPGEYTLHVTAYPELGFTQNVPSLPILSSCLTQGTSTGAQSDPFSVLSGTMNMNFDLGFVLLDGHPMPSAIAAPPQKNWTGSYIYGR
jgi:protocatechuate 3,4-dioxygenase beta subunit